MRSQQFKIFTGGLAIASVLMVDRRTRRKGSPQITDAVQLAVDKGLKWLVSVQGSDGGWGQGGGATCYVRQSEGLESNGNDVANTAVAARSGHSDGRIFAPYTPNPPH